MKAVIDNDPLPPSFLGERLPASFTRHVLVIPPNGTREYDDSEWRDAIVAVERGEVEVSCSEGVTLRFGEGDLLWLTGLPVHALRNPGHGDAVLVGIRRRRRGLRRLSDLVTRLSKRFKKTFDRHPREE